MWSVRDIITHSKFLRPYYVPWPCPGDLEVKDSLSLPLKSSAWSQTHTCKPPVFGRQWDFYHDLSLCVYSDFASHLAVSCLVFFRTQQWGVGEAQYNEGTKSLGFFNWCLISLDTQPWASYLTFLSLNLLVCKVGAMMSAYSEQGFALSLWWGGCGGRALESSQYCTNVRSSYYISQLTRLPQGLKSSHMSRFLSVWDQTSGEDTPGNCWVETAKCLQSPNSSKWQGQHMNGSVIVWAGLPSSWLCLSED